MRIIFTQKEGSNIVQDIMEYNNIPTDKLSDCPSIYKEHHSYTLQIDDKELSKITLHLDKYRHTDYDSSFTIYIDSIDDISTLGEKFYEQIRNHTDYAGYTNEQGIFKCPIRLWHNDDYIELSYTFKDIREKLLPIDIYCDIRSSVKKLIDDGFDEKEVASKLGCSYAEVVKIVHSLRMDWFHNTFERLLSNL